MKHYIVYKTVNQVTGQFYIGVHAQMQDDSYLGSGLRLKRQIKKHGRDVFSRVTLSAHISEHEAFQEEIEILRTAQLDPLCLNISSGGDGGPQFKGKHHTEESRQAISANRRVRIGKICAIDICANSFYPKNDTQQFCSVACRGISRRRRPSSKLVMSKNNAGKFGAHLRWHVRRNTTKDSCVFCYTPL